MSALEERAASYLFLYDRGITWPRRICAFFALSYGSRELSVDNARRTSLPMIT